MIWNDDTEKTTGISREEKYGRLNITYVDIVLCKNCKYRYNGCCYSRASNRINFTVEVPDDWFCADGKRR